MDEQALREELRQLAARLERIEQTLGLPADEHPTPRHAAPPRRTETTSPALHEPSTSTPPPSSPVHQPERAASPAAPPLPQSPSSPTAPSTREPDATAAPTTTPPPASPPHEGGWEVFIGGKGLAWIGAVVVVLGAALLIRLGFEQGWWSAVGPAARAVIIAIFGAALVTGGEITLRFVNRLASVGLYAAGLGTLYLDAYATFEVWNLLSAEAAFVMMAVVAALGFTLTARTTFLTIGVISLVCGYATPLLLHGQQGRDLELLVYLTVLFAVALGLSAFQPRAFRPLRYVALGGQMLLGLVWLTTTGSGPAGLFIAALVFFSGWWCLTTAEALYAAYRRQSAIGNVLMTLLGTAAFVTAGAWVLRAMAPPGGVDWLGLFTLLVAIISAAAAFQFGDGLDGLRRPLHNAMDRLVIALWLQAGVLLVVAAAVQFDGYGASVSWLAIALLGVEMGRRLPRRSVAVFGLVVGGLALLRIVAIDEGLRPLTPTLVEFGPVTITRWSLLALLAMAAALTAAWRLPTQGAASFRHGPWLATAAAASVWLFMCVANIEDVATTIGWTLGAFALLAAQRFGRTQRVIELALALLALAAMRWLAVDAVETRLEQRGAWATTSVALNTQMAAALLITAGGWWAAALRRHRDRTRTADGIGATPRLDRPDALRPWHVIVLLSSGFLLVALGFEVDRLIEHARRRSEQALAWHPMHLRLLGWIALASVGGAALAGVSRWRRWIELHLAGGWLLTAAAGAWCTIGTMTWRIVGGITPVAPLFNAPALTGILTAALLAMLAAVTAAHQSHLSGALRVLRGTMLALLGAIGLVLGSLELERVFIDEPTARQAALSVYWCLYGVGLVVLGFIRPARAARHAGLALLLITIAKVLIIDLSQLADIWRVVSFIVTGLLLIATSVLYARLAPRLLRGEMPA